MEDSFFNKKNYLGVLIGVGLLIVGYFALSRGPVNSNSSMNVAPIILFITYCVVFPVAIMMNKNGKKKE